MRITIKPEVFKKFHPKLELAFILVEEMDNKSKAAKANHLLTEIQKVVLLTFNKDTFKTHYLISPWETIKQEFGKKAKHYNTSVELLLEKALRKRNLKSKDTVTALLRYVALKQIIPFGADDLNKLKGDITFEIKKGDLCYRDGKRWLGKKLDYWKNTKTALRPSSTAALIHFEFLPPMNSAKQKEVLDELAPLIQTFCGGKIKVFFLDKKKNMIQI